MTPRMNRELDGQFGDYQNEIYINGLSGVLPAIPMEFQELEARAQAVLSPSLLSYVAGGAGDEFTQRLDSTACRNGDRLVECHHLRYRCKVGERVVAQV